MILVYALSTYLYWKQYGEDDFTISNDTSVKALVERMNPLYAVRVGVSSGSGVLEMSPD